MKKFLAFLLAAIMMLAIVSCGTEKPEDSTTKGTTTGETTSEETTTETTTETSKPEEPVAASALDLMNEIWNLFGEDEKFPAMGGDFSEENMTDGAPGKYGIEDAALLDSTFGIPEGSVALIDEAASLIHMMNANTFTGVCYHVKNSADVTTLAAAIKDNLMDRQWMCGFPDELVIISVGDYVVSVFGYGEIIESFKTKTLSTFDGAKLLYEESLL